MKTSPKLHRIVSKNGRILCLAEYHSVRQVSPNPFCIKVSTKLTPRTLRRRRESNEASRQKVSLNCWVSWHEASNFTETSPKRFWAVS